MNVQPFIDDLTAEIAKLTAARDALQILLVRPTKAVVARKKTAVTSNADAKRKRWAEAKRKQRAKDRKAKK